MSSIYTLLSTDLINATFDDINTNFSNLNTDKMEKSNNLSDLTNASTARTNLGVNTTANQTDSTDKRFVTDAEKTKLTNLSGTNTGDQNLFSTIAVSGQSNVVADTTSDTLTLVAGTNITITTDASTDSITINASSGAPKEFRITIPGELVADTSNYQGMYFKNTSGASWTISNVSIVVAKAAAGTGAAAAVNLYKSSGTNSDGINTSAVNLFTSAIDLGTGYTSLTNTPNTTTVENGRWLSLRVTSSAGATNKASDLQVIITLA